MADRHQQVAEEDHGVEGFVAEVDHTTADAVEQLMHRMPLDDPGRLGLHRPVDQLQQPRHLGLGDEFRRAARHAGGLEQAIGAGGVAAADLAEIERDVGQAAQGRLQPFVGLAHQDGGPIAGAEGGAAALVLAQIEVSRRRHPSSQLPHQANP
ncbi:MAG: hypothetical protein WDM85_10600 [Caulobacteraceae bacterium]